MSARPFLVGGILVLLLWSGGMAVLLVHAVLPAGALGRTTTQFPSTWPRERI